jgi:ABC-type multidrug transport system fused ATPase/permease subunit
MFWISPELASVTLGVTLILVIICIPFGVTAGKLSKSFQEVLGEAQTRSTEALGGMRTVQSFAAEDRERNRYQDVIGDPDIFRYWWPIKSHKTTYKVGFHKSLLATSFFTFIYGFGFGAMLVSLWYGFKLVVDEQITLGDLTAFQSYIVQIGSALRQTSRFISQVIEARGASSRIFNLLDRVPAILSPKKLTSPKSTVHRSGENGSNDEKGNELGNIMLSSIKNSMMKPSSMTGGVELRNVYFSYPSRTDVLVLRDFCLTIPPNTTAALVGSSGGGKSTVVALLQRFYEIDSGSILIDGNNIHDLDLAWMRRNIGYVQQEPQLFGLTVRQNVSYGLDRQATDDEIFTVCKVNTCVSLYGIFEFVHLAK